MKIDYQDRIEDYLLNRMSNDERFAFEHELDKNPELRDQYEFTSMVKTALMLENIEGDVKKWGDAYKARREDRRSSKRHVLYWISGIAAIFIVGFFLYDSLFVVYDANPSIQEKVVFKGAGVNDSIDIIMKEGDFSAAMALIEKEENEINDRIQSLEQEKAFNKIDQDEYNELCEELMYRQDGLSVNKAKALAGLGRYKEALSLLDRIRHSESDYQELADSLYQDVLKELR